MKLRGNISDTGMRALERSFGPCLEKFGKECYVLINPLNIYLLQDSQEADGLQTCAKLDKSIVFESNTLVCTSTENNHIAFKLQLEHLRNVLKTATVEKADSMIMKLVRRNLYAHHDGEISGPRPMLAFSWESSDMAMEQQMPVGEPCHCNEVARLCGLCDVASFCPFYIDFLPVLSEMTNFVNKLRTLCDCVTLSISRQGDLHLAVNQPNVLLGIGFSGLNIFPESAGEGAVPLRSQNIERRMQEASEAGDSLQAVLSLNHLLRVLQSCPLSHPNEVLCGIRMEGDTPSFTHVMFKYSPQVPGGVFDNSKSLFYKVPVKEE